MHLNVFIAHEFIICKSENHRESMKILITHIKSSVGKWVIKLECKEMTSQHLWEIRNLLVLRTAEKDYFKALTLAEKWIHIKGSWPWLWLIQYVLLPYTWFNLN